MTTKHQEVMEYTIYSLKMFCSNFTAKCIGALVYMFYSFAFDTLHTGALFAIFFLIIADFITGIIGAKFSGEEISSAKVFRSSVKSLIYFILIAAAHVTEGVLPNVIDFADEIIIGFLAVTEFISIIENVGKMGFAIPKKLLNKLQKIRDDQ